MNTLPTKPSDFAKTLQVANTRAQGVTAGSGDYIKMDKTGHWIFGQEEMEVEDGSLWAINPASFMTGFVAWDDGKKAGEEMAGMHEPELIKRDLPDVGAQWQAQVAFQMVCLTGEDEGKQVLYNTNSYGGKTAFAKVVASVTARVTEDPNDPKVIPCVELESESYKHKEYGKLYNPIFEVRSWMSFDDMKTEDDAEVEKEEEEEVEVEEIPKKRTRRRRA